MSALVAMAPSHPRMSVRDFEPSTWSWPVVAVLADEAPVGRLDCRFPQGRHHLALLLLMPHPNPGEHTAHNVIQPSSVLERSST